MKKFQQKKDVISISDEKLKCLENPDYRIYLINNPKRQIKKNEEIIADQILIGSSYVKGQVLTIKKTMKKTKPKFLFALIFILFITL